MRLISQLHEKCKQQIWCGTLPVVFLASSPQTEVLLLQRQPQVGLPVVLSWTRGSVSLPAKKIWVRPPMSARYLEQDALTLPSSLMAYMRI